MDYYEQFKPGEQSDIVRFAKGHHALSRQVTNATKRLENERDLVRRLRRHIDDLKDRAGESLGDNQNSYEKYRRDLTHSARELATSEGLVLALTNEFLPGKRSALRDGEMNLKTALNRHLIESRHKVDFEIDSLLRQCLTIIGDFLDAFSRIYGDFGAGFITNDESYYPGPWTAEEIGILRRRLKMDLAQQDTPAAPQTEQAPVEPSEPVEPEAEPAPAELEGTTITMLGAEL